MGTSYGEASRGRIWVIWDLEELDEEVLYKTDQFLHCDVKHRVTNWHCSILVVNALNSYEGRRGVWELIESLAQNDTPWLLVEDFNAVTEPSEWRGGTDNWP